MPTTVDSISADQIKDTVRRLIDNLVNIKDETGEFLLRLDDGRVIDTKGWNDWEWTHGIGLYGIFKHWELSGDPAALDIMLSWFRNRFAAGTPTKNVNTVAPFLTAAYLAERTGDRSFLPYLDVWAEWIMREMPRTEENGLQHIVFNSVNPQQIWDDTLMMCVLPLAKIGLLLDGPPISKKPYANSCCTRNISPIARRGCGSTAGPSRDATILRERGGRAVMLG